MSTIEVKTDPYDQLFEQSQKNTHYLTKFVMVVYYVVFNILLVCIALDSYYEFMRKGDWFVLSISLIVLNNFCQFLRYIWVYD